jgi:hypothetical protein
MFDAILGELQTKSLVGLDVVVVEEKRLNTNVSCQSFQALITTYRCIGGGEPNPGSAQLDLELLSVRDTEK